MTNGDTTSGHDGMVRREFTPRDALEDALGDLTVPVLYDMDIGHLPPQLILVNGASATVTCSAADRSLTQRLV